MFGPSMSSRTTRSRPKPVRRNLPSGPVGCGTGRSSRSARITERPPSLRYVPLRRISMFLSSHDFRSAPPGILPTCSTRIRRAGNRLALQVENAAKDGHVIGNEPQRDFLALALGVDIHPIGSKSLGRGGQHAFALPSKVRWTSRQAKTAFFIRLGPNGNLGFFRIGRIEQAHTSAGERFAVGTENATLDLDGLVLAGAADWQRLGRGVFTGAKAPNKMPRPSVNDISTTRARLAFFASRVREPLSTRAATCTDTGPPAAFPFAMARPAWTVLAASSGDTPAVPLLSIRTGAVSAADSVRPRHDKRRANIRRADRDGGETYSATTPSCRAASSCVLPCR